MHIDEKSFFLKLYVHHYVKYYNRIEDETFEM